MKQALVTIAAMSFLGFTVGCNGGSKAPTDKPVATPIQPDNSTNLPAPPKAGAPPKK